MKKVETKKKGATGAKPAPRAEKGRASAKDPKKVKAGLIGGVAGAKVRWGENHGKTLNVRAFVREVERFRANVPELKDRAAFVTDALKAKMDVAGFRYPDEPKK